MTEKVSSWNTPRYADTSSLGQGTFEESLEYPEFTRNRDFLMSTQITGNVRAGTCPHGLPPGACPICSGMGGGGNSRTVERKPGELTWSQCYAIGQMMKAQKLAKQEAQTEAVLEAQKTMAQAALRFAANVREMLMKLLPAPVASTILSVSSRVLMPVVRFVQNAFSAVQSALNNVMNALKEKLANISDKLAAVFGELKAAIDKKISDKLKELKKKVFNLFGISETENEEEEKRVEEEKRLFDLKNLKETIFNIKNFEDDDGEEE